VTKPARVLTPCVHADAAWRLVGASHALKCRRCGYSIQTRFATGNLPSTAVWMKRADGTYGPYEPRGWQ
jgi:hypothetical protein